MHLTRFRKTDGLTGQSRDPGSQPQVLTFNLLRVAVARLVRRRLEMTRVGPIIIRVITLDPKWLSQRFQAYFFAPLLLEGQLRLPVPHCALLYAAPRRFKRRATRAAGPRINK